MKIYENILDDSIKCRNNGKISNRKFIVMMLMVLMSFFVIMLFNNIVLIIMVVWNDYGISVENIVLFILIKIVIEFLMYINYVINFFLYCVFGRKFWI